MQKAYLHTKCKIPQLRKTQKGNFKRILTIQKYINIQEQQKFSCSLSLSPFPKLLKTEKFPSDEQIL